MRLLRSEFEVETRYGGRFVQSIDGLAGGGASGRRDWFFFVNGLEADVGAAEYELSPGDGVQWDLRNWAAAMRRAGDRGRVPRAVSQRERGQAAPGASGVRGGADEPCREVKEALQEHGRAGVRLLARRARHRERDPPRRGALARGARSCAVRRRSRRGPRQRRVRALRRQGGRSSCSTRDGEVARTVRPGDGTALVAALRPLDEELVWLVTAPRRRGRRRRRAPRSEDRCATPSRSPSPGVPLRSYRWRGDEPRSRLPRTSERRSTPRAPG